MRDPLTERWLARTALVFIIGLVVMWGYMGPRPATTFTIFDVAGAAFLFAVLYAVGYSQGSRDTVSVNEREGRP